MRSSFACTPNFRRCRRIVALLVRRRFGSFPPYLHLQCRVALSPRLLKSDAAICLTRAENLRLALEELGPKFVKLGQILSPRPDVLGAAFIRGLSKLEDAVPPNPWENIHAVLAKELGSDPEQVFRQIAIVPMAAALLADAKSAVRAYPTRRAEHLQC